MTDDFEVHPVGTAKRLAEKTPDLVKRLRNEYAEAAVPTHNTLSTEPRYECAYCTCVELAPNCHHEKCIALVFGEAADRIEALEAALQIIALDADNITNETSYMAGVARTALEDKT